MDKNGTEDKTSRLLAAFDLTENQNQHTFEFDIPGLPGFSQQLVLQLHTPDFDHEPNAGDPMEEPGDFKVVFTLNRPGFALLKHDCFADSETLQGDSHLAIAKPANTLAEITETSYFKLSSKIDNEEFVFNLHANTGGFLGKIELETIEANGGGEALLRAYRGLTFVLSSISFRYDIPMNIFQIDVIELKTGTRQISIINSYKEISFLGDPMRRLDKEFNKYAGYYREGLNSNSSVYQFLCFYKIIEGVRARRAISNSNAREKGAEPVHFKENIPDEKSKQIEWLNRIFFIRQNWDLETLNSVFPKESLGRNIGNIISKESELHKLRLKIAHGFLEDDKPTLSVDDVLDIESVRKWLPLTKCLARYLLNLEFPDQNQDETPKQGIVKLYRSTKFNSEVANGNRIFTPIDGSLEYMRDLKTEIYGGKVKIPSFSMDMVEQGIGMDDSGNPTLVFVGMEVHEDGSEHKLFTGHYDLPSSSLRIYGKTQ